MSHGKHCVNTDSVITKNGLTSCSTPNPGISPGLAGCGGRRLEWQCCRYCEKKECHLRGGAWEGATAVAGNFVERKLRGRGCPHVCLRAATGGCLEKDGRGCSSH